MPKFLLVLSFLLVNYIVHGQMGWYAPPKGWAMNVEKNDTIKIKFKPYAPDKVKKKGYSGGFEFGGLFGVRTNIYTYMREDLLINGQTASENRRTRFYSPYKEIFFSISTTHGYMFNPKLYMGGGGELDINDNGDNKLNGDPTWRILLPFFTEFKYTPLQKKVSPFICQRVGYTFSVVPVSVLKLDEQLEAGPYLETKLGAKIYISSKAAFLISLAYRFQDFVVHPIYFSEQDGSGYIYPYETFVELRYQTYYKVKPMPANAMYHSVSLTTGFSF
ncbi:MAG: hypothetical protein ACHQIM_22320 [Sphingobacteriales bacterium]